MGYRYSINPPGGQPEWLHGLFTLLVVAAIVAGVVLIARQWRRQPASPASHAHATSPAIHELDLRYARGEIERADYMQRRADILDPSSVAPAPAAPGGPPS